MPFGLFSFRSLNHHHCREMYRNSSLSSLISSHFFSDTQNSENLSRGALHSDNQKLQTEPHSFIILLCPVLPTLLLRYIHAIYCIAFIIQKKNHREVSLTMTQTIMVNNNTYMSHSSAALSSLSMRGNHMQQPPQQPMAMNRGRADSGSTTFSSSSDTSSSNRSKTSIRRRSHRPRGCRGGSSRKKRRAEKVPKEIIGATMSLSSTNPAGENIPHHHDHHPPGRVSDENAGGSRAPMGLQQLGPIKNLPLSSNATSRYGENKQMQQSQRSLDATVFSKVEKARAHPPVLPPLQKKAYASKAMNSFSMDDRSSNRSIISNTTTDNSASGVTNHSAPPPRQILPPLYRPEEQMQDTNNDPPKQNIYALQPRNHHQGQNYSESTYHHDYHDDTFVDSNSNMNYYPGMEYQNGYNPHEPYNHQQHHDNHGNSYGHQIAQLDQQQQHYNGNNDYGQNYSTNANNNYGFVVPNNNYEADFPGFQGENHAEPPPVTNNSSNSNYGNFRINVNTDNSSLLPVQKIGGANTYHTERIEKQRQMMAEGGSLFVTSPRSFLMGWKSDDVPRCM